VGENDPPRPPLSVGASVHNVIPLGPCVASQRSEPEYVAEISTDIKQDFSVFGFQKVCLRRESAFHSIMTAGRPAVALVRCRRRRSLPARNRNPKTDDPRARSDCSRTARRRPLATRMAGRKGVLNHGRAGRIGLERALGFDDISASRTSEISRRSAAQGGLQRSGSQPRLSPRGPGHRIHACFRGSLRHWQHDLHVGGASGFGHR